MIPRSCNSRDGCGTDPTRFSEADLHTIFVTGGSGFLGRTFIGEAIARGLRVRALARSPAAAAAVKTAGAEPVQGALDDVESMCSGMDGCDVVFHAGAVVDEWGPESLFRQVNVVGTQNVLEAARRAGVPRLVHVSTIAVLAGPGPLVNIDEKAPRPVKPYGLYALTKGRAEEVVLSANSSGLATIVVRPGFVWGRGDTSVLPKIVEAVHKGRFRWIAGGRFLASATHVRNVCEALFLAAERGRPGEIYFATDGAPVEFRTFVTQMLETQGVRASSRSIPRGVARTVAAAGEWIWRTFGFTAPPPATRMMVKIMGGEVTIDDSKARAELGYVGRMSFANGIEEMRRERAAGAVTR